MKTPKLFVNVGRDNRVLSLNGDILDCDGKPKDIVDLSECCCGATYEAVVDYLRSIRNDYGYEFSLVIQRQA